MAVSLQAPTRLLPIAGIELGCAAGKLRYQDRDDLCLLRIAEGSSVAATFTQNAFRAAPVLLAERRLGSGPRLLVINAGNANAGTGAEGLRNAEVICDAAAEAANVPAATVLPFSTGVIGQQLDVNAVVKALPDAVAALTEDGWLRAADAILTTDTIAKGASETVELAGGRVRLTGITKGSGMICPNMATMLAYIGTDADVPAELLQALLSDAVAGSFNAITVDGDTSTNDACILVATGASGVAVGEADRQHFADALTRVCKTLAQAIVRDAEGATKFVTLAVSGARDVAEARQVAYTVAHSPLVKTALFASDPNWGRILAAVGRSGIPAFDLSKVDIALDAVGLIRGGEPDPAYREEAGQAVFDKAEFSIRIALGRGEASADIWTSDLSHDYVSINADYRS